MSNKLKSVKLKMLVKYEDLYICVMPLYITDRLKREYATKSQVMSAHRGLYTVIIDNIHANEIRQV